MLRAAIRRGRAHDAAEIRRAERQAASDIKQAWLDAKVHVTFAGHSRLDTGHAAGNPRLGSRTDRANQ